MRDSSANTRLTEAELLELGPIPLESIFGPERVKAWRHGSIVIGEFDLLPMRNDPAAIASLLYFSLEATWKSAVAIAVRVTAEPWWTNRRVADMYGADLRLPTSRGEALADRERADERARRVAWRAPDGDGVSGSPRNPLSAPTDSR